MADNFLAVHRMRYILPGIKICYAQSMSQAETNFFIFFLLFIFVIVAALEIVRRFFWGMIFARLGERRWKAWVPGVELWTLFKLGGFPGYASLPIWFIFGLLITAAFNEQRQFIYIAIAYLLLIPMIVLSLMAVYRIGKRLGFEWWIFLIYLFGGELVWLIIAGLVKPSSLHSNTETRAK